MEAIGWTMLFYALGCLIGLFMEPDWHPFQDAIIPMSRGTAMAGCLVVIVALVGLVMASWFAHWRTLEVETPEVDILHGFGIILRREWELLKNDLAMEMRRRRRARFPSSSQAEALELEREARLDILRDCPDFSLGPPLSPMEQDDVSPEEEEEAAFVEHEAQSLTQVPEEAQHINQEAPEEESIDSETSGDEWRRRLVSAPDYDESVYSPEEAPSDEGHELGEFFEALFHHLFPGSHPEIPAPPPSEVAGDWMYAEGMYNGAYEPSSHDPSPLPSWYEDNLEVERSNPFILAGAQGGPASPDDDPPSRDADEIPEERAQWMISPNGEGLVFPEGVMPFNVEESPDMEIDEWLATLEGNAPASAGPEPQVPYEDIVEEERRRWLISPHDIHAALGDDQESILEDVALLFETEEEKMASGYGKQSVFVSKDDEAQAELIFEMDADEFFEQFEET